jgi:hypothetical protein
MVPIYKPLIIGDAAAREKSDQNSSKKTQTFSHFSFFQNHKISLQTLIYFIKPSSQRPRSTKPSLDCSSSRQKAPVKLNGGKEEVEVE